MYVKSKKKKSRCSDAEQQEEHLVLLQEVWLLQGTQRKVIIFNINFVLEPFFSIKCCKLAVTSLAFHLIAAYLISVSSLCEMCRGLDCRIRLFTAQDCIGDTQGEVPPEHHLAVRENGEISQWWRFL